MRAFSNLEQDTSHVLRQSLRRLQWHRSKLGCRGQGVGPAHTSVPICKDSQKQRASFGRAAKEATCCSTSDSPELIPALNPLLFDTQAWLQVGYRVRANLPKVMNHCLRISANCISCHLLKRSDQRSDNDQQRGSAGHLPRVFDCYPEIVPRTASGMAIKQESVVNAPHTLNPPIPKRHLIPRPERSNRF